MDFRFHKDKLDQLCNQKDSDHNADSKRNQNSTLHQDLLDIKCDQCINVCPTNVLQPSTFAEGGLEASDSVFRFADGAPCRSRYEDFTPLLRDLGRGRPACKDIQ